MQSLYLIAMFLVQQTPCFTYLGDDQSQQNVQVIQKPPPYIGIPIIKEDTDEKPCGEYANKNVDQIVYLNKMFYFKYYTFADAKEVLSCRIDYFDASQPTNGEMFVRSGNKKENISKKTTNTNTQIQNNTTGNSNTTVSNKNVTTVNNNTTASNPNSTNGNNNTNVSNQNVATENNNTNISNPNSTTGNNNTNASAQNSNNGNENKSDNNSKLEQLNKEQNTQKEKEEQIQQQIEEAEKGDGGKRMLILRDHDIPKKLHITKLPTTKWNDEIDKVLANQDINQLKTQFEVLTNTIIVTSTNEARTNGIEVLERKISQMNDPTNKIKQELEQIIQQKVLSLSKTQQDELNKVIKIAKAVGNQAIKSINIQAEMAKIAVYGQKVLTPNGKTLNQYGFFDCDAQDTQELTIPNDEACEICTQRWTLIREKNRYEQCAAVLATDEFDAETGAVMNIGNKKFKTLVDAQEYQDERNTGFKYAKESTGFWAIVTIQLALFLFLVFACLFFTFKKRENMYIRDEDLDHEMATYLDPESEMEY